MQAMDLPEKLEAACSPLFSVLPLEAAMPDLVPKRPASSEVVQVAIDVVREPAIARSPALVAGLWLYVDELEKSHSVSQGLSDSTGAFWHAIMHRREGDFWNSGYWLRQARSHPLFSAIEGYDAEAFLKQVEESYSKNPSKLVAIQRLEWASLFSWCACEAI